MPSTLTIVTAVVGSLAAATSAQSTQYLNKQTWYGYPDNGQYGGDSGSSATAYSCDGRGYSAGGSGSYSNPLTCATASGSSLHQPCETFYFPYLEKYLVMQDTCGGCSNDQVDIWIGNGDGGSGEENCENNSPSGNGHNLIIGPGASESVNTNALWSSSGGCAVSGNVYPGNS